MTTEFKMVPVEPTDEMVVAFAEVWYSKRQAYDDPDMLDAYKAMLAAAPASPQAAQPVADNSDWEDTYGPDYEVDDVGSVYKVDTLLSVRDGYCRCGRLVAGHALGTHADSGEVERLRAELCERAGTIGRLTGERDTLRAQLAERDDLLRRARAVIEGGGWADLERDIAKFLKPQVKGVL